MTYPDSLMKQNIFAHLMLLGPDGSDKMSGHPLQGRERITMQCRCRAIIASDSSLIPALQALLTQCRYYITLTCINETEILAQESGIKTNDKLRLALVYLLTTTTLPSDSDFERIERALGNDVGDDLSALRCALQHKHDFSFDSECIDFLSFRASLASYSEPLVSDTKYVQDCQIISQLLKSHNSGEGIVRKNSESHVPSAIFHIRSHWHMFTARQ